MKLYFLSYWNSLPYPRRKVTVIVELCAGLSHTVKPYFCQHSSTLVNDRSRCFGQSERL